VWHTDSRPQARAGNAVAAITARFPTQAIRWAAELIRFPARVYRDKSFYPQRASGDVVTILFPKRK
jgi:hypothetical protein